MDEGNHPESNLQTRSRILDEDVLCTTCGYDLRGLPADGNCPECGSSIAAQFLTINDFRRAGQALWLLGVSFLGTGLTILLGSSCVCSVRPIVLLLIALALGGFSIARAWAIIALCRHAGIQTRLGRRMYRQPLFWTGAVDSTIALLMMVLIVAAMASVDLRLSVEAHLAVGFAWVAATAVCMWAAAAFARSISGQADAPEMRRDIRLQRIFLVVLWGIEALAVAAIPLMEAGTRGLDMAEGILYSVACLLLTMILLGLAIFLAARITFRILTRVARTIHPHGEETT
jgi:hypothetical protein